MKTAFSISLGYSGLESYLENNHSKNLGIDEAASGFIGSIGVKGVIQYLDLPRIEDTVFALYGKTGFFDACGRSHSRHFPLRLRPEVLAQIMLHEASETVRRNAEHYRSLFTSSAEKEWIVTLTEPKRLFTMNDLKGLSATEVSWEPWDEVLDSFSDDLRQKVDPRVWNLSNVSFSTDTKSSRLGRKISFLHSSSNFYNFKCMSLCHIPRIDLLGVKEDWENLYGLCESLQSLFGDTLGWYFEDLGNTLKIISNAASGVHTPLEFWQNAYRDQNGGSGYEDELGGWLSTFVAHIHQEDGSLIEKPSKYRDWMSMSGSGTGIPLKLLQTYVSEAPFLYEHLGTVKMLAQASPSFSFLTKNGVETRVGVCVWRQ